jgi:hypothetical protein
LWILFLKNFSEIFSKFFPKNFKIQFFTRKNFFFPKHFLQHLAWGAKHHWSNWRQKIFPVWYSSCSPTHSKNMVGTFCRSQYSTLNK